MFSSSKLFETISVIVLAVFAIFTGEVVTFIMLGLILIQLHNIQQAIEKNNSPT